MSTSKLLPLLLFAVSGFAQQPDIQRGPITFTGASDDTPIFVGAGGPNGIVGWRLTYFVDGTNITAAQVAIQGADAPTAAACAAATFATITSANADLVESVNPSVSGAQGNVAVKTYFPCIRMSVTAVTGAGGTVKATIAGYKGTFVFPQSFTFSPSGTQNVNLVQVGGAAIAEGQAVMAASIPVVIASDQTPVSIQGGAAVGAAPSTNPLPAGLIDSAGNLILQDYCTKSATFGFTASSGSVQMVAVSGGTTIRICHVSFSGDAVTNLKLVTGTGATCTSPANETGTYQQVLGFAFDFASPLITTAAKTLCINSSASVTGGGTILYSQR
jgi:hypothetical protein